jgi:hypothetical protein
VAWNLDDYEDAATLNRWFIDNFPAGRIETRVEYFDAKDQEVVIKAEIYRDAVDTLSASSQGARQATIRARCSDGSSKIRPRQPSQEL